MNVSLTDRPAGVMPERAEPRLLTEDEAAKALRIKLAELRIWRGLMVGPYSFVIAGRHVYDGGEIDRWREVDRKTLRATVKRMRGLITDLRWTIQQLAPAPEATR